jgi:Arc/MetJ-type ribon-helix-helix transcriptional regulator
MSRKENRSQFVRESIRRQDERRGLERKAEKALDQLQRVFRNEPPYKRGSKRSDK